MASHHDFVVRRPGSKTTHRQELMRLLLLASAFLVAPFSFAQNYPSIAVVDFTSSVRSVYVKKLPELLTDQLVNTGEFDVVERAKLKSALNELNFQASGFVDPTTAVKVGGMLGAKMLVTGNIIDHRSSRDTNTAYNIRTTTYAHHLKAKIEVIDLTRGVKIFSNVAEGNTVLKKTGANAVGTPETQLGPIVASKLVDAMMASPRIQKIIASTGGSTEPDTVTITVTSQPEGADVEIGGVYYGNAGSDFEVPPGLHQINVTLPGYITWSKKVKVQDGLKFNARLMENSDTKVDIKVTN